MLAAVAAIGSFQSEAKPTLTKLISEKQWIHGASDCEQNKDPAIDVLKLNDSSYILRQNKCLHYEAPFIYLFMGQHTAFLQDTGATADSSKFPLYLKVSELMTEWKTAQNIKQLELLVTHSHGHSDHKAADDQFRNKPNVTLVEAELASVKSFFNFEPWPTATKTIDLGERKLTILPLPGHKDDALAVYDEQTKVMLTGDTFYPGRLYVKNDKAFKTSIKRLYNFAKQFQVDTFLGTHIEMTNKPGVDYPMGSTYQPNESNLVLNIKDLAELEQALHEQSLPLKRQVLNKVIIYPIN